MYIHLVLRCCYQRVKSDAELYIKMLWVSTTGLPLNPGVKYKSSLRKQKKWYPRYDKKNEYRKKKHFYKSETQIHSSQSCQVSLQSSFREKQDHLEGEKILDRQKKCINFSCNIFHRWLYLLSTHFYHLIDSAFSRATQSSYSYWPLRFIELYIYRTLEGDKTELFPAESHRPSTLT